MDWVFVLTLKDLVGLGLLGLFLLAFLVAAVINWSMRMVRRWSR